MDTTTLAALRDFLFASYAIFPALLVAIVRIWVWSRPAPAAAESEWEEFEYLPLPART
jgi:hypothetical protein